MIDKIYLNNAATTYPKPPQIIEAIAKYILNPPPSINRSEGDDLDDPIFNTRMELAKLFNTEFVNRIIFTSGSTESLNLAINGLNIVGKHVITTATEHNSVLRPLHHLFYDDKINLDIIPCDENGNIDIDQFERKLRDDTALVAINHCSNVTGAEQDISKVGEILSGSNAILLVDASQSAGACNIDVTSNKIDLLAFTGHKSLYGIAGTGGLYIAENIDPRPLKVGGTGVRSSLLTQPKVLPIYYEAGTPNLAGIIALGEGVRFIKEYGIEKAKQIKQNHISSIIEELIEINKIKLYYDKSKEIPTILSFNIGELAAEEVAYILDSSYNIKVRSGLHCCPLIHKYLGTHPWGTIRVSPSIFSTEEDVKYFTGAVKLIAEKFE